MTTTVAPTKTPTVERVDIPRLEIERFQLRLVGITPLISNKWSEKAREQMRLKQQKKAKVPKSAKEPWRDFLDSMYWISPRPADVPENADLSLYTFGFPVIAFKAAAVTAAMDADLKMTQARRSFRVDPLEGGELVAIEGTPPEMREDMVRVGMGVADLRYRGAFREWAVTLDISYNSRGLLSKAQIVNLFNVAGFAVGIGEWRNEKDGIYGAFRVGAA